MRESGLHPFGAPGQNWTGTGVPDIDDASSAVVMDCACALRFFGARLIARFDRPAELSIRRTRTTSGKAPPRHRGLDPDVPDSRLDIADGRTHVSFGAMIAAGRRVGAPGLLLQPRRLVPVPIQHWP